MRLLGDGVFGFGNGVEKSGKSMLGHMWHQLGSPCCTHYSVPLACPAESNVVDIRARARRPLVVRAGAPGQQTGTSGARRGWRREGRAPPGRVGAGGMPHGQGTGARGGKTGRARGAREWPSGDRLISDGG
jgi:hypothetical protein